VVTDNPGQVHDVDRAIEVELKHLNMDFASRGGAVALPGAKASRRAPKTPARANGGSRSTRTRAALESVSRRD
jgi:hypothetical protein